MQKRKMLYKISMIKDNQCCVEGYYNSYSDFADEYKFQVDEFAEMLLQYFQQNDNAPEKNHFAACLEALDDIHGNSLLEEYRYEPMKNLIDYYQSYGEMEEDMKNGRHEGGGEFDENCRYFRFAHPGMEPVSADEKNYQEYITEENVRSILLAFDDPRMEPLADAITDMAIYFYKDFDAHKVAEPVEEW